MIKFNQWYIGAVTEICSGSKKDTKRGVVHSVCRKISSGTA